MADPRNPILERIGPNKDMQIFIPTYKRSTKQRTLGLFSKAHIHCTLVVRAEEEKVYRMAHPLTDMLVIPEENKVDDIGKTRQFILDWAYAKKIKYLCMADDDLGFKVRGKNGKQSDKADESDMVRLFGQQLQWLDEGIVHCGLSSNSVYQDKKFLKPSVTYEENTKIFSFITMNTYKVVEVGAKYRLELVEDYDFTLQLLKAGLKNRVSVEYTFTPGTSKKGGCFDYRDPQRQAAALKKLAELHNLNGDNIVTLIFGKESKLRPDEKTSARIGWKKALSLSGVKRENPSQDDDGPLRKKQRIAEPTPQVDVSEGPGSGATATAHLGTGHSGAGDTGTGHSAAGHAGTSYSAAGHMGPDHSAAGHTGTGYSAAGHSVADHFGAGHSGAGSGAVVNTNAYPGPVPGSHNGLFYGLGLINVTPPFLTHPGTSYLDENSLSFYFTNNG